MWQVAAMVVGAMFLIVGGDTAGTLLTREGVSPLFVAWSRFAVAVMVLAPFCGVKPTEMPQFVEWRLVLRALLIVCGISCILTALQTEPIANVFGAFFVSPVVAFILSVVLFKERAGWHRAALLLVSFAGVLIVVRPGFGMTLGLGFALLAGLFHGGYLVATKWIAQDYRPRFLLLSQLLIGAILLAPFGATAIPDITWTVTALVLIRPRSVPHCGSVRFMVPAHSPDAIFGPYLAFCSSDPPAIKASNAPEVRPGYIANAIFADEVISLVAMLTTCGKP